MMENGRIQLTPDEVERLQREDPMGFVAGVVTGYAFERELGEAALLLATLELQELRSLSLRLAVRLAAEMRADEDLER